MRAQVDREVVLTACGFSAALLVYLFVIYLPLKRASEQATAAIEAAQRVFANIPQRVAELEQLQAKLREVNGYIEIATALVPRSDEPWAVGRVAQIAREASVRIQKIEPLPPEHHRTYTVESFAVELEGPFPNLVEFLAKLERMDRLCRICSLRVMRGQGSTSQDVHCSVVFNSFSLCTEKEDVEENNRNSQFVAADK